MIWILGQFWDKKADALEERLGPDASALADVLRDFALGANGKTAKKAFSRLLKSVADKGKGTREKGEPAVSAEIRAFSLVPCPFSLVTDAFFISLLG